MDASRNNSDVSVRGNVAVRVRDEVPGLEMKLEEPLDGLQPLALVLLGPSARRVALVVEEEALEQPRLGRVRVAALREALDLLEGHIRVRFAVREHFHPQIKDFHTSLLLVLSFISVVFILAIQSQTSASYMSLIQSDNKSDRNFWQQKQQLL